MDKTIKTTADRAAALQEIEGLMSAERGTVECDRLDNRATLVEDYEAKHFPMDAEKPSESYENVSVSETDLRISKTEQMPQYEDDDGPLTDDQRAQIKKMMPQNVKRSVKTSLFALEELLAACDTLQPLTPEDRAWLDAPAVGRESL